MKSDGQGGFSPGTIDSLSYNIPINSNQLTSIFDLAPIDFKDRGFHTNGQSGNYNYDANSNLDIDPYKQLSIAYNHLNLPEEVNKTGGGKIAWLYDADGNKLQRKVTDNVLSLTGVINSGTYQGDQIEASGAVIDTSSVTMIGDSIITLLPGFTVEAGSAFSAQINDTGENVHDYAGNIEYQNGKLEAIYFEEGRVYFVNDSSRFEYTITDHLGNTRVIFADLNEDGQVDNNELLQEQHYYAFGLEMEGAWKFHPNKNSAYLYNGKELNEDLGLNWYAYGARWYDAAIGRFTGVDPIADQFAHLSTYNYASNNPIKNIDLHGLQGLHYMETLPNGKQGHVLEKNVVVLTQSPKQIPMGASEKKISRIERQNKNRLKSNARKIEETKSKIESYFSDAANSKDEPVRFKFNYLEAEVDNPGKIEKNEARNLAITEHGLEGKSVFEGGPNDIAPAVVVQDKATLQSQGDGIRVEFDDKIPGALAHEVGHTFMRRGQKLEENSPGKGGLMGDPPGHIRSHEVDKMLEDAVQRKN